MVIGITTVEFRPSPRPEKWAPLGKDERLACLRNSMGEKKVAKIAANNHQQRNIIADSRLDLLT